MKVVNDFASGQSNAHVFPVQEDGYISLIFSIKQTYNNFFITLTDSSGGVLKHTSGGASKLRGAKRRTYISAEMVTTKFLDEFENDFSSILEVCQVVVFLRTKPNVITNTIIDKCAGRFPIVQFVEIQKIPHNGMRGKKLRRLLFFFFFCMSVIF